MKRQVAVALILVLAISVMGGQATAESISNYSFDDGLDGWTHDWEAATHGETTVAEASGYFGYPALIRQTVESDLNQLTVYFRVWAVRSSYFNCELYLNYVDDPFSYGGRTGRKITPQPFSSVQAFTTTGMTATWTVLDRTEQTYHEVGDWYLIRCVVSTQQAVSNWRPQVYAANYGPHDLKIDYINAEGLNVSNDSFNDGLDGWSHAWEVATHGETTVAEASGYAGYPALIWQSAPSDLNQLTVYYRVWAVRGSYFNCELYLNYVHDPFSYGGRTGRKVTPQPYSTTSAFSTTGMTATWTVMSRTEQTYHEVGDWYLIKCEVSTQQAVSNWRPQVYAANYGPHDLKIDYIDTNEAPNAPTDPTRDDFGTDDTARFSWTFSDPDPGSTPGAYKLRIRPVGGSTWLYAHTDGTLGDETWVCLIDSYWDLDDGILAAHDYEWQVATMDQDGLEGPYCDPAYFTVAWQSYWFSQGISEGGDERWDRTNLHNLYFPNMAWCTKCGDPQPPEPSDWKCRHTPLWTDSDYDPDENQLSLGHMNSAGCFICSWAMVLRNNNAMTVSEQLDFPRTESDGYLPADPFTVTMANLGWQEVDPVDGEFHIIGYESATSPVSIQNHASLVGSFGLTMGGPVDMTDTQTWTPEVKAGKLTELLNEHSGGLVVRVQDASNPDRRHTLVFTESTYVPSRAAREALDKLIISPVSKEAVEQDSRILYDHTRDTGDRATEGTVWDECFWVCDPQPTDPAEGDNVPFDESWTHQNYGGLDRVIYVWWIE